MRKKYKKYLITTFILLFAVCKLAAQEFNFRNLSVSEGLSQSAVLCLAQDELGYIWAGTADGLNRYNGYEFIHFRNRPGESKSISDNFINCIEPAKSGDLWVGTLGGGLNYFNASNNTFKRFPSKGNKKDIESDDVYAIKDLGNALIIGTNHGLNVSYNYNDFSYVWLPDSFYYQTHQIKQLNNNDVLIAHDFGVSKWVEGKSYLQKVSKDFELMAKKELTAFAIAQLSNKEIWVGTDNGIYIFSNDYQFLRIEKPSFNTNETASITSIYEDEEGNVWVGSNGNGLVIYNINKGSSKSFYPDDLDNFSISDGLITNIIQDKSGVVWIGTYNGGINIYDRYINQFRLYEHKKGNNQSLGSPRVFAICENNKGDLWVGTDGGGLDFINHTFDNDSAISSVQYSSTKNPLRNKQVWSIEPDAKGNMWVGTIGAGLYYYNPVNNDIQNWRKGAESVKGSLSDDSIYSLLLDSKGILWVGTDIGLNAFDIKNQSFVTCMINPDEGRKFNSNTVLAIEEDSEGRIWAGTFGGGLAVVDRKKGIIERFTHNTADTSSLSYNKVMSIHCDKNGRLWIGTFGGGFNIYNAKEKTFTSYTELDGLPNDVVYGFLEDESGYMWMSTNNGLSAFNIETGHFRNFDASCNLQSNEFNQGAYAKGATGRFYFGGIAGLNSFNPNNIKINSYKPPVIVNAFSEPGNIIIPESKSNGKTITLSYNNNNVFFTYVAFNYVNSHLNQYRYKLEGLSNDWVEAGVNRSASFTNLDPGSYTFRVQAANNDGVWNTTGTQMIINVKAPVYLKWWFQPLLFFIAVSLITIIAFLVVKTIRGNAKQQLVEADLKLTETEKESLKYRLTSLRAQMDPHFIFNSLNSIQHFITRNDKESARGYLSKFAKLMRLILNSSREETISLAEELDTLQLYIDLERLRFDYKFDSKIIINDSIDADDIEVPTMLLQPYVENAIIHGLKNKNSDKGLLKILIEPEEEGVLVIIEDNGIGRKRAAEIRAQKLDRYKSLGMQVTQDRLQLWSETRQKPTVTITDLFNENNEPCGTQVKVFIKVSFFD
ncbi:MAG: ligand-binding sensor domain-containing protein [Bacteroidia bacterium]